MFRTSPPRARRRSPSRAAAGTTTSRCRCRSGGRTASPPVAMYSISPPARARKGSPRPPPHPLDDAGCGPARTPRRRWCCRHPDAGKLLDPLPSRTGCTDNDVPLLAPAAVTYTCPLSSPRIPCRCCRSPATRTRTRPACSRRSGTATRRPRRGKVLPGAYGELPWRFEELRHVGQGEPVMYAAWFRPRDRSKRTEKNKEVSVSFTRARRGAPGYSRGSSKKKKNCVANQV